MSHFFATILLDEDFKADIIVQIAEKYVYIQGLVATHQWIATYSLENCAVDHRSQF